MMLKKFLDYAVGNTSRKLELEVPVSDFLPYACHYDENTLLTKNGELLQTVKLTGFANETVGTKSQLLRDVIRQSIQQNITTSHFALWIHTVRRKTSLEAEGRYHNRFSRDLNRQWNKKHQWNKKYVNEVYITVLYDGKTESAFDFSAIIKNLSFSKVKRQHIDYLENALLELTQAVDGMLETLGSFGARRLTIEKYDDERYYSQPLQFISKLLNLSDKPVEVPLHDVGEAVIHSKAAFGFNTLEVVEPDAKHFGMLYTLKNYFEMNPKVLDRILQLDQQFVITQTLDFINHSQALKDYRYLNYVLQVSGDERTRVDSGLADILAGETNRETDYGESQISIFLISDSLQRLEKHTVEMTQTLQKLGVIAVRRDLRLEECYWAQFPGNFSFISRKKSINSNRVAGYASLHNFPAGQLKGNHWGEAITTLRTAAQTPYFFNFHVKDNGHTSIVGPFGMGKTSLMNFLVAQAQKHQCRLFYFDQERASKVFVNALGGYYTVINPTKRSPEYAFNPLQIPDSPENRAFLKKWFVYLAENNEKALSQKAKEHLAKIVDHLYTLPQEQRRLSTVSELFGPVKPGSLGEKMAPWHGTGKYAHLFDNDRQYVVPLDGRIYGFGMSGVVEDGVTLGPVLSYLFHRVEMALDGKPTMVILDEAWNLVNNTLFAPGLAQWLERLKQKNAMVIFATESVENVSKTEITKVIVDKIATQLYLPNEQADASSAVYRKTWRLSSNEFDMLKNMDLEERQFMLKQAGASVVASLDLAGMKELKILSGGDTVVALMETAMASHGLDPEDWLPELYRKLDES